MDNVSHIEESKKYLVIDVDRLDRLGVRLEDSPNYCFMAYHNFELYLAVEVKSKQHLDQALMELKELVHGKLNETFSLVVWCLHVPREVR